MSSDWEEIKRLAADFQRAQSLSTSQRLSERNCVEIVNTLVQTGQLQVYHTCDGKEYVTAEQVVSEIREELQLKCGRVSVHELCQQLNLDLSCVEAGVRQLATQDRGVHHVCDCVLDSSYMDHVTAEVNDLLQQSGTVDLDHLTCQYDLAADFFKKELLSRLSSDVYQEPDAKGSLILFTETFVARERAKIVGALSAVTAPVSVSQLIQRFNIKERLFFHIVGELVSCGRVRGSLTGGKQSVHAVFVPECHAAAQNAYADRLFQQHRCIEFDALRRAGITDPETFVRRRFKHANLVCTTSYAVAPALVAQIQQSVELAVQDETSLNILQLLPDIFTAAEAGQLLEAATSCDVITTTTSSATSTTTTSSSSSSGGGSNSGGRSRHARAPSGGRFVVMSECVVVSEALLANIGRAIGQSMPTRAAEDIASGRYPPKSVCTWKNSAATAAASTSAAAAADCADADGPSLSRKEERRRRAAGGKSGGGAQGRETRTRSTKKKYGKRTDDAAIDEDEESAASDVCVFLTHEQLAQQVCQLGLIEDASDLLVDDIAKHLYSGLQQQYQQTLRDAHGAVMSSRAQQQRHSFAEFQQKVTGLLVNCRLFEKAANEFDGDTRVQLLRHLLRTTCSEIVVHLCTHCLLDNGVEVALHQDSATVESRVRLLDQLPADVGQPLLALSRSLAGHQCLSQFHQCLDQPLALCSLHVRKIERKRERQQAQQYIELLSSRLAAIDCASDSSADQMALFLHMSALLLYHSHTGNILNASGKFVPAILGRLKATMTPDNFSTVQQFQDLVIQLFRLPAAAAASSTAERSAIVQQLLQLAPSVRQLVTETAHVTAATAAPSGGSDSGAPTDTLVDTQGS